MSSLLNGPQREVAILWRTLCGLPALPGLKRPPKLRRITAMRIKSLIRIRCLLVRAVAPFQFPAISSKGFA